MQPSQVVVLVSILFGLGGLLLGFLLGNAWANRQHQQAGEEETASEPDAALPSDSIPSPEAVPAETPPSSSFTPLEATAAPLELAQPAEPTDEELPPSSSAPVENPTATSQAKAESSPSGLGAILQPFTRHLTTPAPPKPAAPPSMIEQINSIFKQTIAGTPLAERNIRLVQDPTLGVTVVVGEERFAGIDQVPDEGIRAALKAAVKKWEEG